ncbi:MAG TPA: hypothetical protein IAB47_10725 [Candidatus Scatomorpha merdigallinarum]|nr:hypothetical protein [Candidatus Scatomorpha merdigallinarum]
MSENPNEKSAVTKGTLAAGFSVASVWFGTHVGAGFATGNQVLSYYVNYGWTAAIYPLISMGVLAYVIYVIMKFARLRGLDNYNDTFRELWQPYPQLAISFEIFYIIIILAAVAAAINGAALLVQEFVPALGIVGSTIIVAAVLILLCLFGVKLIIAASTVLTVGIIVTAGLMIIVGIANRPDAVFDAFSQPLNNPGEGFWRGVVIYCGFQCVSIPPMIAAAVTLNQKGVKKAGILGGIMNGGMLALSGLMLLGWKDDIIAAGQQALPNLFICNEIGWSWLVACYSILLFCAFISTCVTLIYTMILRIDKKFFVRSNIHEKVRMAVIGVVMVAICMSLSFIGISDIITYAYGYDGYLALVAIVIPVIIIGNIKNKKYIKEHPECLQKYGNS